MKRAEKHAAALFNKAARYASAHADMDTVSVRFRKGRYSFEATFTRPDPPESRRMGFNGEQ
ncbi:MAG: hypothetical protein LBL66_10910 [Clostridiales bacterium]|jgi:hypothetical protein|nr:hypothetical protein [Clostridiales bacterium]